MPQKNRINDSHFSFYVQMQEHTQRVDESLVVHLLYLREVAPVSAQIPNTSLL